MKKTVLAAALTVALFGTGGASAASFADELAAIKARLNQLEQQVTAQNQVIREKDREIAALKQATGGGDGGGWFNEIEIGGVVEVEAGWNDPYTGDDTSDVVVATVELGIAAQINDWVGSEIVLLYEEDDTDLEIDVATITIANPDGPWFVTSGQQYLPFGTFETNLVSDPLTLEIGETRESAVLLGIENDGFGAAVYVFNGDNKKDGDDRIDNFGAVAGYGQEGEDSGFAVNVGYINDIGDSDSLQAAIADPSNLGSNDVADHVAGWSVDALFSSGPFVVIAEYVAAMDEFQVGELPFAGRGAEPSAFNVEAGYNFMLGGKDATVAIAYQGTDEAFALDLPETRVLAAVSVEVMANTTVSLEWAHDEDYDPADGGTGESANTATAQLAVEF